jgi:hypothetical protein
MQLTTVTVLNHAPVSKRDYSMIVNAMHGWLSNNRDSMPLSVAVEKEGRIKFIAGSCSFSCLAGIENVQSLIAKLEKHGEKPKKVQGYTLEKMEQEYARFGDDILVPIKRETGGKYKVVAIPECPNLTFILHRMVNDKGETIKGLALTVAGTGMCASSGKATLAELLERMGKMLLPENIEKANKAVAEHTEKHTLALENLLREVAA